MLVTCVKFVELCSQVMKMARAEASCAFQATLDSQLPKKQMRNTYCRETKLKGMQQNGHRFCLCVYES